MDIIELKKSDREIYRINKLLQLVPQKGNSVLDVGARDGYISIKLTDFFDTVISLDLKKPDVFHKNIIPVEGDVTSLNYPDNFFHTVLCSEVLEHIPNNLLLKACDEIKRVADQYVIIGVPYKQDIRVGRTTCYSCG